MNEIAGVNGKLLLDFVGGAGFTGIAVAVMGRNHPFGIVLASLLFGALFQGGAEVAFEVPGFSRDMTKKASYHRSKGQPVWNFIGPKISHYCSKQRYNHADVPSSASGCRRTIPIAGCGLAGPTR